MADDFEVSNRIRNESWYECLSTKLGSTQLTHALARIERLEFAEQILKKVIDAPDRNRLGPDLERQARSLVADV